MPHQVNGSQRIGGGHVWPRPLDSPNGKLGLAQVVLAGCLSIGEGLPDDVLKVRVHVSMRAQSRAKEKLRHDGGGRLSRKTGLCQKICRTPRMMSAQKTTLITNTKRTD